MWGLNLVLSAIAVLSLSGLPGCLLSRHSKAGQRLAVALMLIGSVLGLAGLAASLGETAPESLVLPWFLPWGQFAVALDPLSAVFLGLIFVVPVLGSIYGLSYWKQSEHPENGRRLGWFYGLLAGSMALVAIARDGVLFLIAWEVMALAAYFVATVEEENNPEVRQAGWVYLVATHVGTLCLLAMFALWHKATGAFALTAAEALPEKIAGIIFILALIGFGFKAGLMPLHIWLPGAHANAPSHVSAVMSGVMLKMGIYGIIRMTALCPVIAPWWGGVLLGAGAVTGLAGITFAIAQHDLKRMLAYSSIENIGIIAMGLGLALLGRAFGHWEWVLLGLGGALLHVLNHGLFKSLLFWSAGAVIHAAHTRDMDQLGGLAKRMPRVMVFFFLGAAAVCALPPLNGWVGEWLLYLGLFHTLGFNGAGGLPVAGVAVVVLAMIGALAVAGFVKLLGSIFLGSPRSNVSDHAEDPPANMLIPMAAAAAGCLAIGLFPGITIAWLEQAARTWTDFPDAGLTLEAIAPLGWITVMGLALLLLTGLIILMVKALPRVKAAGRVVTWDCGYAQPAPRMQYTGSGFGQMLVAMSAFVLRPKNHWPNLRAVFPKAAGFKSAVSDVVLDRLVLPLFKFFGRALPSFRILQQGQTHFYVLYILMIVILLLIWGVMGA